MAVKPVARKWIRLDTTWSDVGWVAELSPRAQYAWLQLLCHVRRSGRAGHVRALSPRVAGQKWSVGEEAVVEMLRGATTAHPQDATVIVYGDEWVVTHWKRFLPPPPSSGGSTWRHMRPLVFQRDDYACVYCGSSDNLQCDHVVPRVRGGTDDLSNLVTACSFCNQSKGAKDARDWTTPRSPVM